VSVPVIGVINQKGGVGKTTTAINLSAALAQVRNVLLVDLDPQANATSGLGLLPSSSVYDVLSGRSSARKAVLRARQKNLWVLPASAELAGAAIELDASAEDVQLLAKALIGVRPSYEFIVLDAPPSFGALTLNALAAADLLILPVQCEYYALEGIAGMMDTIDRVRAALNPDLRVLGLLLTMADNRTNLSQQVEANVRRHFGELVFDVVVPRSVRLAEAPSHGLPIFEYAPGSAGAVAYEAMAQEVLQRVSEA
jgi:chromosome partitioning protein